MTEIQIIRRLWGHIYDLIMYIDKSRTKSDKTLAEIVQDLEATANQCRVYADFYDALDNNGD